MTQSSQPTISPELLWALRSLNELKHRVQDSAARATEAANHISSVVEQISDHQMRVINAIETEIARGARSHTSDAVALELHDFLSNVVSKLGPYLVVPQFDPRSLS